MLSDVAQITSEPAALDCLLTALGYRPQPAGAGLFARGAEAMPTLLFPLHAHAAVAIRQHRLVGRQVACSAAIAAGLAALRSVSSRPALLFAYDQSDVPQSVQPEQTISMQGGVVPRIWPNCFGRLDLLVRIGSRSGHRGQPGSAVNAIECGIPILQSLMRLKADLRERSFRRTQASDSPLQPRLTISAVHGGHSGAILPSLVDLVVSRRYDPAEDAQAALAEIDGACQSALQPGIRLEMSVIDNRQPVADPRAAQRSREEHALAAGWGWPQVRFCSAPPLLPGAVQFGGLETPDCDPDSDAASTTLDDMAAFARSIRALLSAS